MLGNLAPDAVPLAPEAYKRIVGQPDNLPKAVERAVEALEILIKAGQIERFQAVVGAIEPAQVLQSGYIERGHAVVGAVEFRELHVSGHIQRLDAVRETVKMLKHLLLVGSVDLLQAIVVAVNPVETGATLDVQRLDLVIAAV